MTFTPAVEPAIPARPKWLTLAAAGVIVVAVFGILGGLSALAGLLFSRFHPFAGMPGITPEMAKMFELQEKAMSGPAPALSTVVGILGIAVGVWVISAAVRVLGAKPGAQLGFRRAVVLLGNVELASLILGVWMQIKSFEMMSELAETIVPRTPSSAHVFDKMKFFMQGGAVLAVALALGYGLLKLGFLAWAYRYSSSRDVVAHLDRPA